MEQTLEYRSFVIRSVGTEEDRTFEGIAVPYGQTIDLGEYKERFESGVFGEPTDVKIIYNHNTENVIGRMVVGTDKEDGFHIKARISDTPKGNEIRTLMQDGVLDKLSVGFLTGTNRVEKDGTVVRVKAELKEVSVVAFPAYSGAVLSEVRSSEEINKEKEDKNMSEETKFASVTELEDLRSEMDRRFAVAGEVKPEDAKPQFRTGGDYLKALAMPEDSRHDDAKMFTRVYSGTTTADTPSPAAWYADLVKVVQRPRTIVNLFSRGPLDGLQVTYAKQSSVSGAVASQGVQGADLTLLALTTSLVTKDALTFGVASTMTEQQIRYAKVEVLNDTLQLQAKSYAKITNDYARTVLVAAEGSMNTSDNTLSIASSTTGDYLKAVSNSIGKLYTLGEVDPEFVLVSGAVWETMGALTDSNKRPAFAINGDGQNTIGNVSLPAIRGSIDGLPIVVDYGLSGNKLYVGNSDAFVTWEDTGAPFNLDDRNPLNLSRTFTIWGTIAADAVKPKSLTKVTVNA